MELRGDEEIRVAADSFNKMAESLQKGIEDRENFLKYAGHELKTPLAKAKFALEMRDFDMLKKSINDMDSLVKEILDMHLLSGGNLNREFFGIQTLITESLAKLYISEEENIEIEFENFSVYGDVYYMSTALKNLIDNALKYTERFPVKIVAKDFKIDVVSYGKELKRDFNSYKVPFKKEDSKGYGLGLSIVETIVKKHGFSFLYEHKEGKNVFSIKFGENFCRLLSR